MYSLTFRGNDAIMGQGLSFEGQAITAYFEFAGTPLPAIFNGYPVFTWTIGERTVLDPRSGPLFYGAYGSYTTTQADVGQAIAASMRLPFREEWYEAGSIGPLTVVNVNDLPQGSIRIEGDTRSAGSVLSAVSTITDEDGMGALSYQWRADGQPIAGATGATLTLGQSEAGKTITVVASYVDGFGQAESVASDADPNAVHVNTLGSMRVSGTLGAGQTLHAEIVDPDHAGKVYYQWQVADGKGGFRNVEGAWGSDFTPGVDLPGAMRVMATYADRYGNVEFRQTQIGTEGADRINESGPDLSILARGGDDVIEHRANLHRIDGGEGLDTFITAYSSTLFRQTRDVPGQWEVADMVYSYGAPIYLTNVERIHFSAGADGIALDYDGHAGQAYRLYQAAFDRTPDKVGQGFWMNRLDIGVSLRDIADAFVASNEFKALYGADPSNAGIVAKFYQNVLHRAPDAHSQFWVDVLDSKRATVAEVLVGFSESAENVAALVGVADRGIDFTPYTGA